MNVNVVVLGGRLTRDVDLRVSSGGMAIANIGFVCNRKRKDAEGSWVKEPVFVDVKMFGKRAEAFAKYHKKGSACMFPHCELRLEQWEDRTSGDKRSRLVVVADDWEFVGDAQSQTSPSETSVAEDADSPF